MLKVKEIINQMPVISTDTPIDSIEISTSENSSTREKFIKDNSYRLFIRSTNIDDIYKFGCQQLIKTLDHGVGYIWPSRSSIINGQFDTEIADVYINDANHLYGMSIDLLKSLLEDYYNEKITIDKCEFGYDDGKEILYKFIIIDD